MSNDQRLTPEREAHYRNIAGGSYPGFDADSAVFLAKSELLRILNELDAVRRARDEAREWRDVWNPDVARWQRLYAECVGDISDVDLGRLVRSLARESYAEAAAMAKDGGA